MAETALAPNIYGYHIASGGGNQGGIGAHWIALDSAGKVITLKSVGNIGDCNTVARMSRASGIPHVIVLRLKGKDDELELPNYDNPAIEEGPRHLNKVIDALPKGLDNDGNLRFEIDYIWLEIINEPDEDRAEWVGEFMYYAGLEALLLGYKLCGPGWAAGTPREMSWQTPAWFNYLKLCQDNPNQIAVSTHEYSYNKDNIYDGVETLQDGSLRYWKIGRFLHIIAACKAFGLRYPKILFTEWGWELWDVPDPNSAIADIQDTFNTLYAKYPGVVIMAAIWYLGPGFMNIANKAQKLIAPSTSWILANTGPPVTGNGEPPPGECIETDVKSKVIQMLRPRALSPEQNAWIRNAMTNGLDVYGTGELQPIGTEGWAHTDIMRGVKDGIAAGYLDSRLIVVDGHLIGDGLDRDWMAENCSMLEGHTVYFTTSDVVPPPDFKYEVWPSDHMPEYVTQHWGDNPATYAPFGQPGHGGIDIRAHHGETIRVVADGTVYRVERDAGAHNFGIHVRVDHRNGTEQTIYAHFASVEGEIDVGSMVKAGDVLGQADNTGFSFGSHLHFARKRRGETYTDEYGTWPYNLFDPSPLLAPLAPHLFSTSPGEITDIVDDLPQSATEDYDSRNLSDITTLVIHHTAGGPFQDISNIAWSHVNTNGWPGIGYHYVIDGGGNIFLVNYHTTHSFHANEANGYSIGIALQGNFTVNPPPQRQQEAARWLVDHLFETIPTVDDSIPHRHAPGSGTVCPGDTWESWWTAVTGEEIDPPPPPPTGKAGFGLHASADPGDLNAAEIDIFRDSKPEVIKVLSAHAGPSIGRLSEGHPDAVFIIRAFLSMAGRDISPQQFLTDTINDTTRALNHIQGNQRLIELHNEPNLVAEGMGTVWTTGSWANGSEFNDWYLEVLELYKAELPGEVYMYPGLSPGPSVSGVRQGHSEFLRQSAGAIAASDVLGLHAYWASEPGTAFPMPTALHLVDSYVISFPGKELWVTESSNNRPETPENKAEQYIRFWKELRKRPAVKGVTYYVASASDPQWGWGPGGTGQIWEGTDIARLVGQR